ncbi:MULTISPECIES: histone deacetylase family protein [unclassified Cocleimonas]|uniref:histone deacetylase family protein n=1 Tax=unclassified Cocleimonas TaxID=2639732 RepID=UPI002605B713|nr:MULTISPECIES: histone deacetylase family protein [unclassified Cocleimonas]MEB8431188.1 histone deacetylase family protein [Cocleimonas sp. KMM 6892]MEC4714040.1 histone deacetylase family protein [Cocleimonas sp. KMM 6895]MEC4743371.1 histone deacetylase family protein [Cocleimonas sp. KMM 6896]
MKIIYSDKHYHQSPKLELAGGDLVPSFENPSRAEHVLERARTVGLDEIISPDEFGIEPLLAVHDSGYIQFLQTAWQQWIEAGFKGEIIPLCWPAGKASDILPQHIKGKVGYYAQGTDSNITEGTWTAALAAAQSALTGASLICKSVKSGNKARAFSLGRPPGHHAAKASYGGYSFLNNAAITAQYCRDQGIAKVAVLDVDFHHGNGTQDIFYDRDDVFFASIHGDPMDNFPYFWGHASEQGEGIGEGFNLNFPLSNGTTFAVWREALKSSLSAINEFGAEVLIVSLGVDTFEDDPISSFKLKTPDYLVMGADIADLGIPTLFVMEGGYNVEALGINMVNVLQGYEASL